MPPMTSGQDQSSSRACEVITVCVQPIAASIGVYASHCQFLNVAVLYAPRMYVWSDMGYAEESAAALAFVSSKKLLAKGI